MLGTPSRGETSVHSNSWYTEKIAWTLNWRKRILILWGIRIWRGGTKIHNTTTWIRWQTVCSLHNKDCSLSRGCLLWVIPYIVICLWWKIFHGFKSLPIFPVKLLWFSVLRVLLRNVHTCDTCDYAYACETELRSRVPHLYRKFS